MTLTTIQFYSEDEAAKQMALLASEARVCRTLQTPLETAGSLEVNQDGFGSLVVFKKGVWVIQLHTAQPSGVTPLLDLAGVEAAARLVADRV